jgi:hypothetical protein
MTPAEQAGTVGGVYVHLPEYEGVIWPEGHGWVYDDTLFPYWTPTAEVVAAAESRLPAFLRSFPPNLGEPEADWLQRHSAPLILPKLREYKRQYSGILLEGRLALFINLFLDRGMENWVTTPVDVDDGGYYYFQVVYRPEEGDFVRFWVNGEA